MNKRDWGREEGSMSLICAALISTVLLIAALCAQWARGVLITHQLQLIADLAATAAAAHYDCQIGHDTARAHGAQLSYCRLDGEDAVVGLRGYHVDTVVSLGAIEVISRAGP